MRALLYSRMGVVELSNEPEPVAGPGEVIVNVAFSGICGSDLHRIRPGGYGTPPLIMGHEFSGTTSDGRRVAVCATLSCGECDLCLAGLEQLCRNRSIIGIQRNGGFAERVAVPERALAELPANAPLEAGALVEPLAVTLRAWNRSGAGAGSRIGILGSGAIGLFLLMIARIKGATDISVVDINEARLGVAKRLGASHIGKTLEGEYDVLFDAVGAPETRAASVDHQRPGGTAVWLGCKSEPSAFNALDFVRAERSVLASFAYTLADFKEAASMTPDLPLDWVDYCTLDQSAEVFMDLVHGKSPSVKVLITPS